MDQTIAFVKPFQLRPGFERFKLREASFKITPYRLFYIFCGVVYPCIALGAVYLSYRAHPLFGLLTASVLTGWAINSFATTCRRCADANSTERASVVYQG
jgi:hypothetical protein